MYIKDKNLMGKFFVFLKYYSLYFILTNVIYLLTFLFDRIILIVVRQDQITHLSSNATLSDGSLTKIQSKWKLIDLWLLTTKIGTVFSLKGPSPFMFEFLGVVLPGAWLYCLDRESESENFVLQGCLKIGENLLG